MVPMAKVTFKALLDWFMETGATKWCIHVQASQFDTKIYTSSVGPETGMLVLNISPRATRNLECFEDSFGFNSTVNGKVVWLEVPYSAIFVAVDPDSGIPNLFPYFEDHGNPEPVTKFTAPSAQDVAPKSFKAPTLNELMDRHSGKTGNPTITRKDDGVIRLEFPEPKRDVFYEPPAGRRMKLADLLPFPVTEPSAKDKVKQRKWTVIQGGRTTEPKAGMPWIDEVYRAKQAKRATTMADHFILGNEMKSSQPEIRSDELEGKSMFFPDLDVSKCMFASKRRDRPDWLKVINGGK